MTETMADRVSVNDLSAPVYGSTVDTKGPAPLMRQLVMSELAGTSRPVEDQWRY